MSALLMARDLERLMIRHSQTLATPDLVPLAPPTDHPLVLEGFASTTDVVDAERAPLAFGASLPKDLPLLYNHDAKQPVGTIDALYYDAKGQLLVRAPSPTPAPGAARPSALVPGFATTPCATPTARIFMRWS